MLTKHERFLHKENTSQLWRTCSTFFFHPQFIFLKNLTETINYGSSSKFQASRLKSSFKTRPMDINWTIIIAISNQVGPISSWKTTFLFVCFVALRPKSTAMVIAGQSVHLTTLFPGQA